MKKLYMSKQFILMLCLQTREKIQERLKSLKKTPIKVILQNKDDFYRLVEGSTHV